MVLVVMLAKVEPKLLGAADEKQQVSNDMNMELPILLHRSTMVNNRPKMSQFSLFPPISLKRHICNLQLEHISQWNQLFHFQASFICATNWILNGQTPMHVPRNTFSWNCQSSVIDSVRMECLNNVITHANQYVNGGVSSWLPLF